jgi:dTDP-4-amino-4,6-dideoxygalactose transaminase
VIPISKPDLGPVEEQAVIDVLRSGMLAMGRRTAEFEEAWAAYCGVKHAVFMANGTVALEAVLRALGIGPGNEVITVSFTFNATVSAIVRMGARPVFVDIAEHDFCIDPDRVEAAITPRTKAIMPVHLYGLMADMDSLVAVAQRHGIPIVEDAAQAHGASYRGRRAGQFGPAMFSLYATKNLMTGEGGFATTDDDRLADHPPLQPRHARPLPPRLARHERRDGPAAALGLRSWPASTSARSAPAHARLTADSTATDASGAGGQGTSGTSTRCVSRASGPVATGPLTGRRDPHLLPGPGPPAVLPSGLRAGIRRARPPITNRLAKEVLSLPVRPNLSPAELDAVISAVREVATPVRSLAAAGGTFR